MLKKTTFCLFIFALLLGSGNLLAQKPAQFSVASPQAGAIKLPEGAKVDLRNAADLTEDELRVIMEKSTCGDDAKMDKAPDACFACTGFNCTGTCFRIQCGTYINANQQIPPVPGFRSFVTGCTTTYVSTCNDLSTTAPCQGFAFQSAQWGNNTCVNSNQLVLQSVGCL